MVERNAGHSCFPSEKGGVTPEKARDIALGEVVYAGYSTAPSVKLAVNTFGLLSILIVVKKGLVLWRKSKHRVQANIAG